MFLMMKPLTSDFRDQHLTALKILSHDGNNLLAIFYDYMQTRIRSKIIQLR